MSLACQKDSYRTKLISHVKSCTPSKQSLLNNGKKETLDGFDVILEDTVLFPEGGGQPDDRGTINDIEVLRVFRKGSDAVHFIKEALKVEQEVTIIVNWVRRWDHMQQHSAQHLITAITEKLFGYKTTSWNLGDKVSFIELDTSNLSSKEVSDIENDVNSKIRQSVKMTPMWFDNVNDPMLNEVRTRGLPDDHVGSIRVVTIEGIESNMCCGTHVSNLAHLQAIKLLNVIKGKKNKINLYFIAGQRLLNFVQFSFEQQQKFTGCLKGGPEQHLQLLENLQKNFQISNKNLTNVLRDIAKLESEKYKFGKPEILFLHKPEGNNEFMSMVVNEIDDKNLIAFLTCGDERGQGLYLIVLQEELIKNLSQKISELLDGKGFIKGNRFQGKANKLSNRNRVFDVIKDAIKKKD